MSKINSQKKSYKRQGIKALPFFFAVDII